MTIMDNKKRKKRNQRERFKNIWKTFFFSKSYAIAVKIKRFFDKIYEDGKPTFTQQRFSYFQIIFTLFQTQNLILKFNDVFKFKCPRAKPPVL